MTLDQNDHAKDQSQNATEQALVNINISDSAAEYLQALVDKQETNNMGVRIFVEKPGTPYAECCMAYCPESEADATDHVIEINTLKVYLKQESLLYLVDAEVDYNKDRFGGQLTFRAPQSKIPQLGDNASLDEKIFHVLQAEINPMLASHGGNVSLERLEQDNTVAVLRFGGGCQGCASVDLTLKEGVEKTLMDRFPELKSVVDATDHSITDNAYYS